MNVAVLCPGPSLAHPLVTGDHRIRLGDYDSLIAVNKAGVRTAVNTWVILDGIPDGWFFPSLHEGIRIIDSYDMRRAIMESHPDRLWTGPWCEFAAGWACIYAAVVLGATHIDAFGMDMTGDKYWDGSQQISDRPKARWQNERRHVAAMQSALAERGVEFRRVGVPAPEDSLTCSGL